MTLNRNQSDMLLEMIRRKGWTSAYKAKPTADSLVRKGLATWSHTLFSWRSLTLTDEGQRVAAELHDARPCHAIVCTRCAAIAPLAPARR